MRQYKGLALRVHVHELRIADFILGRHILGQIAARYLLSTYLDAPSLCLKFAGRCIAHREVHGAG